MLKIKRGKINKNKNEEKSIISSHSATLMMLQERLNIEAKGATKLNENEGQTDKNKNEVYSNNI